MSRLHIRRGIVERTSSGPDWTALWHDYRTSLRTAAARRPPRDLLREDHAWGERATALRNRGGRKVR
jgi:hypothetical protein